MITHIPGKTWAGHNLQSRTRGQERALTQAGFLWMNQGDAQMFANLQRAAWAEDPRPLSHVVYYSREED